MLLLNNLELEDLDNFTCQMVQKNLQNLKTNRIFSCVV